MFHIDKNIYFDEISWCEVNTTLCSATKKRPEDIAVDGWALAILRKENVGYAVGAGGGGGGFGSSFGLKKYENVGSFFRSNS